MPQNRVVVTDLAAPRELHPAQRTNLDLFDGAPKPIIDHDKQQLASALQAFSSSLNGLFSGLTAKQQQTEEDKGMADIQQLHIEGGDKKLAEAFQAGTLPGQHIKKVAGWSAEAAGKEHGRAAWTELRTAIDGGNFPLIDDKGQPRDIDNALSGWMAPRMQITGLDDFRRRQYLEGFQAQFNDARDYMLGKRTDAVAGFNKEFISNPIIADQVGELFGKARGMSDDTLDKSFQAITGSLSKELGTHPLVVEQHVLDRATKVVADTYDPLILNDVERILHFNRNGFDGVKVGPIAAKYRDRVVSITEAINKKRETLYDQQVRDEAVKRVVQMYADAQSAAHGVEDIYYENEATKRFFPGKDAKRVITAGEITKIAAAQQYARIQKESVRAGIDISKAEDDSNNPHWTRTWGLFVNNNVPNKDWQARLNDQTLSLANPPSMTDPNMRALLVKNARLYEKLMQGNAPYVTQTLKIGDDQRKLFDRYIAYRDALRMPDDEAIQNAVADMGGPEIIDPGLTKAVQDRVSSLDFNGWRPGGGHGGWLDGWANMQTMRREVMRTATVLIEGRKMDADKAVEAAVRLVQDRTIVLNGQAIADPVITKDRLTAVQTLLNEKYEKFFPSLDAIYDISSPHQLSIRAAKNGVFQVTTSDGQAVFRPVFDKNGNVTGHEALTINTKDISSVEAKIRADAEGEAAREARATWESKILSLPDHRLSPTLKEKRKQIEAERSKRAAAQPDLDYESFGSWPKAAPSGPSRDFLDVLLNSRPAGRAGPAR
jgi:hypothetical protein